MKFLKLTASNFLTLGSGSIALDNRGLNIIQGVNEDDSSTSSNGAGKSSVVDALCWALFGVTARGAKGDAIVNRVEGKNTSVILTMVNGDTLYKLERYRKHKTGKNQLHILAFNPAASFESVDCKGVRLDKGTEAESQKVLDKILGCSYEVFIAAVYAGQEMMPDLPRMTDRELKRLIEEAAGLQRIERAYQVARECMNENNTGHAREVMRLATIQSQLEGKKAQVSGTTTKSIEWEGGRSSRTDAAGRVVESSAGFVLKAEGTFNGLDAMSVRVHSKMTKLNEQLAGHSALLAAASKAQATHGAADRRIDRTGLAMAAKKVDDIKAKITGAADHMGKACVECGKPHTQGELDDYLTIQNRLMGLAVVERKAVACKVAEQLAAAEALKTEAEAARAAVPDVSAVNAEVTKLRTFERAHQDAKTALDHARLDLEASKRALARIESEPNPHQAVLESQTDELRRLEAAVVESKLLTDELQAKLQIAESVVKLFGPAGVRAQILDTVTPYLNDRTADYLSVLSDGNISATWTTLTKSASGELKEKFSIDVTNRTGADDFTGLSGGEKRKVRLATALGLQDLVASRAVQPIDLWVGDEVDDALDGAGLERLMTILERKARERGTVLVISHNSLSDWCDSVTTVRKVGGKSVIEGALTE